MPRKPSHFGSNCHPSPAGSSFTSSASIGGNGTFGPGIEWNLQAMTELDGVWKVDRVGGALPPLYGCVKRINGARGTTDFSRLPGMPFEVRGLELHYQAPFNALVDKLEPRDGEYFGRATLLGREIGQFTMRRLDPLSQLKEQLVKHIDEAYAMEQNVLRMLDGMISTTDDPEILDALEHHKMQTQGHADRMKARLEAHDATPSGVKQVGGILQAMAKMPLDMVRGEKSGRNARDGFATEHMEIASYELLRRIAQRAGDQETASAAAEIITEEQEMANTIAANWDKFAELSLREEGVTV
jgi:ferritin-like metal-binding protein YciE